jgi:hypothetical protein
VSTVTELGGRFVVGEAGGIEVFVSGEEAKEVAIGEGAKGLSAVRVVAQAGSGKDGRPREVVFAL